jgi:hypothetical protein
MTDLQQLPKRTVRIPWVVLESAQAGTSLVIQFLLADRGVSKARVLVHESDLRISVAVEQEVLAEGVDLRRLGVAFTPMRRTPIEEVILKVRVGGRHIEGEGMSETSVNSSSYLAVPGPEGLRIPALPSVIGLAPQDAIRVLSQQGFVAVVDGHGREVVEQLPPRGEVARNRHAAVYDIGEPVRILTR